MGSRDYRRKEKKKSKKDTEKVSASTILTPPVTVEVIKKGKKVGKGEEEE